MVRIRLLWSIVRRCHTEKFLILFVGCFLFGAVLLQGAEPKIHNYWDSVWFLFEACTSIGFGDFVPVTVLGRITVMVLTCYEIFLVAMVSGIVVSHYLEVVHRREKHTATVFLDKLEHLSELSEEEIHDLEQKVKKLVM